jgi:hypothetical protein
MRLIDNMQELLTKEVKQEIIRRRKAAITAIDQAIKSGDLIQA